MDEKTAFLEIEFDEWLTGCHRTVIFNNGDCEVEVDIPPKFTIGEAITQDGYSVVVCIHPHPDKWEDEAKNVNYIIGDKKVIFHASGKGYALPYTISGDIQKQLPPRLRTQTSDEESDDSILYFRAGIKEKPEEVKEKERKEEEMARKKYDDIMGVKSEKVRPVRGGGLPARSTKPKSSGVPAELVHQHEKIKPLPNILETKSNKNEVSNNNKDLSKSAAQPKPLKPLSQPKPVYLQSMHQHAEHAQNNGNQIISAKPKTVPKPAERGGYNAPLQTHNKKEEKKKGKCIIA